MRIAIDISQVVYGTGVSQYTKNLVKALLKIDKENEYILFAGALRRKADVLGEFPQTKIFPIPPILANFLWNRLHVLPIEKLIGQVDLFHTSDWSEPPSIAPKVTTIHDLYALKFPKMINKEVRETHRRKLSWVFQESKMILVPSKSTKDDLLSLDVPEERIRVIPEAPAYSKAGDADVASVKTKYGIKGNYLIAVGASPLKNTSRIIKAFHLASAGKDIKLILAGRPTGIEIPVERNIRALDFVPAEDMGALLTGSQGLIFASIYEGYGIPILDAFNCGVPVVTSGVASMPEVAGDAAALVDPHDVNSIADGIEKILRGPKGFIEKGNERVKEFSWDKTASATLAVYKEVAR